jgi:hypothetical protein
MAIFCSCIQEWLPFASCYSTSTSIVLAIWPWLRVQYEFFIGGSFEALADPLSPHCSLPNFWTSDPTSRPMFNPPGGKVIPRTGLHPLKVHDEILCRWKNLHRAHVRDFFNFSIRTVLPIDPWQGIGWENAPPMLQNGLRSILPLIFFSAPRPMLFAPTYQTKKLRRNSKCVSCLLHRHPICSRFATERAHCFHDATCQILPSLLRMCTTGSRIMGLRAAE